jgi:hypothetical protein
VIDWQREHGLLSEETEGAFNASTPDKWTARRWFLAPRELISADAAQPLEHFGLPSTDRQNPNSVPRIARRSRVFRHPASGTSAIARHCP